MSPNHKAAQGLKFEMELQALLNESEAELDREQMDIAHELLADHNYDNELKATQEAEMKAKDEALEREHEMVQEVLVPCDYDSEEELEPFKNIIWNLEAEEDLATQDALKRHDEQVQLLQHEYETYKNGLVPFFYDTDEEKRDAERVAKARADAKARAHERAREHLLLRFTTIRGRQNIRGGQIIAIIQN